MNDTVFWSWQNDLTPKTNRSFLREAIAIAVDRVSAELDVEDVERLELDHDTKASPGMTDISQTILTKIANASVMIADVTPIGETSAGKALPNPNVMVELGYGLHSLGFERIIAILNTASGYGVEDLPFDIRHRRILTYELSHTATKDQFKAVRESLVKQLASAIQLNIRVVRDTRSAASPIIGVKSDPKSAGLWNADWPVTHSDGFGEVARVRPHDLSRAWLRIIPDNYPGGRPAITRLDQLPDNVRLWAPYGGGNGGHFGSCSFGYVTYWVAGTDEDGTCKARNLAAFLEESGEVWMSDGVALTEHQNQTHISYAHLLSNWARGMERGMACLDALGASKRRRVIIGIEGINEAVWHIQSGYVPARSRKTEMVFDETDRDWQQQRRLQFLCDGWNKLRDAFSIEPMGDQEFAQYYEVRRRS
jgi:hypothetical protein